MTRSPAARDERRGGDHLWLDGSTDHRGRTHDPAIGFMYILECADGTYYTGSTRDVFARLTQHQRGEGSEYTKRRLPVRLAYYEEYEHVIEAFYREHQVQDMLRSHKRRLIAEGPGVRPR